MRTFTLNKVKQGLKAKTGTKVILHARSVSMHNHCGLIFGGKKEKNLLQNSLDNLKVITLIYSSSFFTST